MTCSDLILQALLLSFLIIGGESLFFWGNRIKPEGTDWDKLSVTWGKFSSLPIKASDAQSNGWKKFSSCKAKTYFKGNRFVIDNDKSVMLLFDANGKIAGIQFGILKSLAKHPGFRKSYWVSDGDSLVITAYFVHPSVICNGGRKDIEYIGENLYIQIGSSSGKLMKIPLKESDLGSTRWVKGKCFYTMGEHYWYNISNDMKCEDFFPVFLLYNGGKLNGFGWALAGDVRSGRVEHPTPDKFHYFFDEKTLPRCLNTAGILTTEHIYLQRRPYLNFC